MIISAPGPEKGKIKSAYQGYIPWSVVSSEVEILFFLLLDIYSELIFDFLDIKYGSTCMDIKFKERTRVHIRGIIPCSVVSSEVEIYGSC